MKPQHTFSKGFTVLLKDPLACSPQEPGIEPMTVVSLVGPEFPDSRACDASKTRQSSCVPVVVHRRMTSCSVTSGVSVPFRNHCCQPETGVSQSRVQKFNSGELGFSSKAEGSGPVRRHWSKRAFLHTTECYQPPQRLLLAFHGSEGGESLLWTFQVGVHLCKQA